LDANRKLSRTFHDSRCSILLRRISTFNAIPRFVGARDIADAKAQVSAAIGITKECQTWVQTRGEGMAEAPTFTGSVSGSCDENDGGTLTASWTQALPAGFTGIDCLGTESTGGESTVSIRVDGNGDAVCTLA
jgi:hypothetical protein